MAGTSFTLPEIQKIAKYVTDEYKRYAESRRLDNSTLCEYPSEELDHAIANVLNELHLKTLANQLLNETKVVRGD